MTHSSIRPLRHFLIPIGLLLVMLIAGSSIAVGGSMVSTTAIAPHIPGVTPLLSYQGRLVDPATGAPKPNGTYEMSFRLYTVASNGTALWTETRDVQVSNGVFSVLLGEITGLNTAHFTGQELWLAIKVGADAEATPRQHLAHVAYALFAENAALLNGQTASAFAPAAHAHSGADITSGTVADGRVAPTIARDNEVFSLITAADGTGSGLDADLLDGLNSGAFATAAHAHSGADITSGTVADARVADTLARDSEVFSIVTGADGTGSGSGRGSVGWAEQQLLRRHGPQPRRRLHQQRRAGHHDRVQRLAHSASHPVRRRQWPDRQHDIHPGGQGRVSMVWPGHPAPRSNSYSGVLGDSKLGRGVVGVSGSNDGVIGFQHHRASGSMGRVLTGMGSRPTARTTLRSMPLDILRRIPCATTHRAPTISVSAGTISDPGNRVRHIVLLCWFDSRFLFPCGQHRR